jgi:hypothetical protein
MSEEKLPEDKTHEEGLGVLGNEFVQKIAAKAILSCYKNKDSFLDFFLEPDCEEADRAEMTLVELAIETIAKLKTVELAVLQTLHAVVKEQLPDAPKDFLVFMRYLSRETTLALHLLNKIVSPEELRGMHNPEEIEICLKVFDNESIAPEETKHVNLHEVTEELKSLVTKIRAAKTPPKR